MKKPILIHTNKNKAYEIKEAWEKQLSDLKNVCKLYTDMGLPALVPGDLNKMSHNTTEFLFDKLSGGEQAHLAIGGGTDKKYMPINKMAALEIMVKPKGWDALIAAIKSLAATAIKGIGAERFASYQTVNAESAFTIEDGEIYFSESTLKKMEDAGCFYITSDAAKKIHKFMQDTVKAYYDNGMDSVYKNRWRKTIPELFMELVESMDDAGKTFVPNVYGFAACDRHIITLDEASN